MIHHLSAKEEFAQVCAKGALARVKELIAYGVDVNEEVSGHTPLNRAAAGGHHMVVKTLLRAGARPRHTDLVAAICAGSRHSANHIVDEMDYRGLEPLAFPWATVVGKPEFLRDLTPEIARWLVDSGIDLHETDSYGRSILTLAKQYCSEDVCAALGV